MTNLGERFHVLCVSVVVRGLAVPVAWKVLRGGQKEAWNPHWAALPGRMEEAVPDDWTVVVLSDRGLESPALFRAIAGLGWHPLMRVKKGGKFRPAGWGEPVVLVRLAGRMGVSPAAEGRTYSGEKLRCTLLALRQVSLVHVRGEELMAAWSRGKSPLPQRSHPEAWVTISQPGITLDVRDFLPHET